MNVLKMNTKSVRWAFNCTKWNPSHSDIILASSCIQPEEKDRLARFVFKKDLKSSLIGRLMMRKFISEASDLKYDEITLIRDQHGKPLLLPKETNPKLNFNVSHQGNYVVLAGESDDVKLGVDVMKLEYSGGKPLYEFFRLMTKHFSSMEWDTINKAGTEKEQTAMFCRHWCLKESYVKAIGVGITVNLQEISFKIHTKELGKSFIVDDTEIFVKGQQLDWQFQEMLLDDDHCVAVALNVRGDRGNCFSELGFTDLMRNSIPLLPSDEEYSANYFKKLEKL